MSAPPTPPAAPDTAAQTSTASRNHRLAGGLLVFLTALAIRIYTVANTEVIQRDGVNFIRFARQLFTDSSAAIAGFNQHAGYPFLIATVHAVLGPLGLRDGIVGWELSGQIVSVAAGTLATMGVWALTGLAFNWRVAWVSALIFAVGRKWVSLGADVMSDSSSLCLFIWSIVLGVLAARANSRARVLTFAAAAGVLTGLSYLVRPEGLGAMLVVVTLLVITALQRRLPPRRAFTAAGLCILLAILTALPYMISIGGITKKKHGNRLVLAPSPTESPLFALHRPALTPPVFPFAALPPPLLASITPPTASVQPPATSPSSPPHPRPPVSRGPASDRSAHRALLDQTIEAMHPVAFGLACVWAVVTLLHFSAPPHLRKPYLPLPSGPGAVAMLIVLLLYGTVAYRLHLRSGYLDWRHCMHVAFAAVPLAGAGLIALVDFLAHLAAPLRLKSLSVRQFVICQWCWVFPLVLAGTAWQSVGRLHGSKTYVRQAAERLRAESKPGDFAVTNLAWVVHYAQVPGRAFETAGRPPETLLPRLAAITPRPTHLVLSDRWLGDPSAELTRIVSPPQFQLLATFRQSDRPDDEETDRIRIYRITWPDAAAPPTPPTTRPN